MLHVLEQLRGYLLHQLLAEVPPIHSLPELDELHDVPGCLCTLVVGQSLRVPVKHLHIGEVVVADTHDDDRAGEGGQLDKDLSGFPHIHNDPVGENQQQTVLLATLLHIVFDLCLEGVQDLAEISWTAQSHLIQRLAVDVDNSFDAVHARILLVIVEWEAMGGAITSRRFRTETVHSVLIVVVVGSNDFSNCVDHLFVVVGLCPEVVERALVCNFAVAGGEVDRHCHVEMPARPQIVQELRHVVGGLLADSTPPHHKFALVALFEP